MATNLKQFGQLSTFAPVCDGSASWNAGDSQYGCTALGSALSCKHVMDQMRFGGGNSHLQPGSFSLQARKSCGVFHTKH